MTEIFFARQLSFVREIGSQIEFVTSGGDDEYVNVEDHTLTEAVHLPEKIKHYWVKPALRAPEEPDPRRVDWVTQKWG